MFQGINLRTFYCDDCEFAKHKRVSLLNNNKIIYTPFYFVHSDVWPSNIPNKPASLSFLFIIVLKFFGCVS